MNPKTRNSHRPAGSHSIADALSLLHIPEKRFPRLLLYTDYLRKQVFGRRISLCAIINARSGRCSEDCAFCAQSGHWSARIKEYGLVSRDNILSAAHKAEEMHARRFSIVTSGKGLSSPDDQTEVLSAVEAIRRESGLLPCASLGIVDLGFLRRLKDAGLERYHHNLETAPSFFPKICTTHDYEEDMEVIRLAREAGLETCCGGIFGMGETWDQRIEFILTLRDLEVDAIPINFLNPIPGTPLSSRALLDPFECLKIIAFFRILIPGRSLIICGGREVNLGELQDWVFLAGADGLMIGDYLTTKGRSVADDLQMLKDKGLEPMSP